MRRLATVVVLPVAGLLALVGLPADAGAEGVAYRPPVDAPIVDHFRPPPERWAAGNRGIDYETRPGTAVRAAAAGEVVFAGQVGGSLHVVVLHADGIRTSYSFLTSVGVRRGQRVATGELVGHTGVGLHFGARAGDVYLDPELLLAGPPRVHLVPDDARRPQSEARERRGVANLLRSLGRSMGRSMGKPVLAVGAAAVDWARRGVDMPATTSVSGWATYVRTRLLPPLPGFRVGVAVASAIDTWRSNRHRCTPRGTPAPRLSQRRLLVLVGGLGSGSGRAAVLDVNATRLGYAPGDVMQFSYRGGTTAERPYDRNDTYGDIRTAGARLRSLVARLGRDHPGVPVDVIAHSQGGLVTRAALSGPPHDVRLDHVRTVVTLGSPHRGAHLATVVARIAPTPLGPVAAVAGALVGIDLRATSLAQMSATSSFLRDLGRRALPSNVAVWSIAARGDLVVPASDSRLVGATNVVVSVPGAVRDHDALPGSSEAQREIALAVNGAPPTCFGLTEALADSVGPAVVTLAEETAAGLIGAGTR